MQIIQTRKVQGKCHCIKYVAEIILWVMHLARPYFCLYTSLPTWSWLFIRCLITLSSLHSLVSLDQDNIHWQPAPPSPGNLLEMYFLWLLFTHVCIPDPTGSMPYFVAELISENWIIIICEEKPALESKNNKMTVICKFARDVAVTLKYVSVPHFLRSN